MSSVDKIDELNKDLLSLKGLINSKKKLLNDLNNEIYVLFKKLDDIDDDDKIDKNDRDKDILKNSMSSKKKLVNDIEEEISFLKEEKNKIKDKINGLNVSYESNYILSLLPIDKDIKNKLSHQLDSIIIYNCESYSSHALSIKYIYNSIEYHFHFSRRPDEYYHKYGIFVNGSLIEQPNIVQQYDHYNYDNIEKENHLYNYVLTLTVKEEYYFGLMIACYYFLIDYKSTKSHIGEYIKNKNTEDLCKIITKYKNDCDYSWYPNF